MTSNMFSARTNWRLTPNRIARGLEEMKKSGTRILDLTESNPTRAGFRYLEPSLLTPFKNPKNLRYAPSPEGLLKSRLAICRYYREKGISVQPEQMILTSGTSEAYSWIFRLLADPDERILIPQPSYPLFSFLADLNDLKTDFYTLRYDGGWEIAIESLKTACSAKTKALVLVHPNNPTGSFVKKGEFSEIIRIAGENSMALISDEVFSDYAFSPDPNRIRSFAECSDVLTFTLGGISKLFGLPQMKLSWIVVSGPKRLIHDTLARLHIIADTYLSVGTPVQEALNDWMKKRKKIREEILTRARENHVWLSEKTGGRAADLLHAEGGWYGILKLPRIKSEEEWVLEFLEQDRVLVQPGYFFDFKEEAHVVLSLLPPPHLFQTGVTRILNRIG